MAAIFSDVIFKSFTLYVNFQISNSGSQRFNLQYPSIGSDNDGIFCRVYALQGLDE